jgi:Yip1 domain
MTMESSSFGRLLGALVSPGKTFLSIAERPTWAVPLVVLMLASAVVGFVTAERTDYRDVITQTVREKGRDVPEAQLEPQIEMMEKAGPAISAAGAPVAVVVFTLLAALFYWVAFKLLGSDFPYKSSLSVTLYAAMPAVVSLLLSIPVILSKETIGYEDMKRSGGAFLQSNLAFLAPEGAPGWLAALYASVDFFSLWSLVLTVIGFRAVTRLSTKAVTVTAVVIWLLFVGVRVGLAALR